MNPKAICKKEKSVLKLIPGTFKNVKLDVSVAIIENIINTQGSLLLARKKSLVFLVLLKYTPIIVTKNK
jgi:hypothetical protein